MLSSTEQVVFGRSRASSNAENGRIEPTDVLAEEGRSNELKPPTRTVAAAGRQAPNGHLPQKTHFSCRALFRNFALALCGFVITAAVLYARSQASLDTDVKNAGAGVATFASLAKDKAALMPNNGVADELPGSEVTTSTSKVEPQRGSVTLKEVDTSATTSNLRSTVSRQHGGSEAVATMSTTSAVPRVVVSKDSVAMTTVAPRVGVSNTKAWARNAVIGADGRHGCRKIRAGFYNHRETTYLCLREYSDHVSNLVSGTGRWGECDELWSIWHDTLKLGEPNSSDVFFDVGANIGICTLQFASMLGDTTVYSFEPSPTNLFYLSSSLMMNPWLKGRVVLYPVGLGNTNADMPIYAQPDNAGHSVIGKPVGEVGKPTPTKVKGGVIHVRRMDDIILPPYPSIRLMKIDVEGFETKVLQGAKDLLTSGAVRAVYFELSPFLPAQGSSRVELMNTFIKYGFDFAIPRSRAQQYACREGPHVFYNLLVLMKHNHRTNPPLLSCR